MSASSDPKKAPTVKAKVAKVVILHTQVGMHGRGSVLDVSTFGADRCVQLIANGAMRHATAEECELTHVDLDAVNAPVNEKFEWQAKLNAKQAMIDQLEREVQSLRTINETRSSSTSEVQANELMNKLAEAEKNIVSLQAQIVEKDKKLADAKLV